MGIGKLCCFVAPCGSLQHHQSGMKNFKVQVQTTKYRGTNRTKHTLADNNITEQIVQNIHWQTTKYHGTNRTKHIHWQTNKYHGTNRTKHIHWQTTISRNKSYKTYTGKQENVTEQIVQYMHWQTNLAALKFSTSGSALTLLASKSHQSK